MEHGLSKQALFEETLIKSNKYDFEEVLDDLGFGFLETVKNKKLWEIIFSD